MSKVINCRADGSSISGMLVVALPNNLLGVSFQEQRIYAWNYQRSYSQKHPVKSSLLTCPCSSVACRYEAANQKWEVSCQNRTHVTYFCLMRFSFASGAWAPVWDISSRCSFRYSLSQGFLGGSIPSSSEALQISQPIQCRYRYWSAQKATCDYLDLDTV